MQEIAWLTVFSDAPLEIAKKIESLRFKTFFDSSALSNELANLQLRAVEGVFDKDLFESMGIVSHVHPLVETSCNRRITAKDFRGLIGIRDL